MDSYRPSAAEGKGLLFHYLHFYGTYDYVGDSRKWYDKEIRIIRNDKSIEAFKDAQGFPIDSTPWVNVFLTERAQEGVKFVSMNDKAKRYTIRVREAH